MKIVEKEIILFDKVSISRNILSIEIFATKGLLLLWQI